MINSLSRFNFINYIESDFPEMLPDSSFWLVTQSAFSKSKGRFDHQLESITGSLSKLPVEYLIAYYVKYIGFKIMLDAPYWRFFKMADSDREQCMAWIILQGKKFYTKWQERYSERKQLKIIKKFQREVKTNYRRDPFITIINQLSYDATGHHLFSEQVFGEVDFWKIINRSQEQSSGSIDGLYRLVEEEIRKLSLHQIIIFYRLFIINRIRSYKWGIYQAFRIITNYPDEESFDSFRGWLIGHGEAFFKRVLDDSDSLAELEREEVLATLEAYDALEIIPQFIFKERTGIPLWDEQEHRSSIPEENWGLYSVELPKLTAKYGNCTKGDTR